MSSPSEIVNSLMFLFQTFTTKQFLVILEFTDFHRVVGFLSMGCKILNYKCNEITFYCLSPGYLHGLL